MADKTTAASAFEVPAFWRGDGVLAALVLAYCRTPVRFRGKGRIYQWMCGLLFRGDLPLRSVNGIRFRLQADDFLAHKIAFEGNYEHKSIALAARLLEGGGVFLDVGCNVGLYTLPLGLMTGVNVIAVDASAAALTRLNQNLAMNRGAHVEVVSCALDAGNSLQAFEVPTASNLASTRVVQDEGARALRFWTASMTLDSVLQRLAPGKVRLLKIDVEGYELQVFRGLNFEGPYRPENIIVECIPGFTDAEKCFDFIKGKGYEPLTVEGKPVGGLTELPEHNVWFRSRLP